MNVASLLRLLVSLCTLLVLALPGCAAKRGPTSTPSGGGFKDARAPAQDEAGPLATRGDVYNHGGDAYDYGGTVDYAESEAAPAAQPGTAADHDGAGAYEQQAPVEDRRVARRDRPGLGTSYGEQHFSRVTTAPFVRGDSQPDVVLSLWYNDVEGIAQARGSYGGFDQSSQISTTDGAFVVSVVDEHGYAMSAAQVGHKRYIAGQPGQRYRLRVQNNSGFRYEVVATVDGLDVIDGQPGSFAKRGYIIDPWSTITIDGWRTGDDSVAAFRFSAMEDSYAERKGQGRNIGVMGFAFFHERGGVPWAELQRRDNADPFPRRYAEPPPPRHWR